VTAIGQELSVLFARDLTRLQQQLQAFESHPDALWRAGVVAMPNSAGNLMLHLEGNLREYVGRLLGGIDYRRERDQEFTLRGLDVSSMAQRLADLREMVPRVIRSLSEARLDAVFPDDPIGPPTSTRLLLIHLHGHLNYHLGQIDTLRRILTGSGPVDYTSSLD
jgi:uncharacterized damage-inducible protein DinB